MVGNAQSVQVAPEWRFERNRRLIDACQGAKMNGYLFSRLAVVGNPETAGGFKRYPA
jgi:hypothetical protein